MNKKQKETEGKLIKIKVKITFSSFLNVLTI